MLRSNGCKSENDISWWVANELEYARRWLERADEARMDSGCISNLAHYLKIVLGLGRDPSQSFQNFGQR